MSQVKEPSFPLYNEVDLVYGPCKDLVQLIGDWRINPDPRDTDFASGAQPRYFSLTNTKQNKTILYTR